MAKRLFDIALAGFALLVLLPLMALAGIGVVLTSPGPMIYTASRVGRGRRVFRMYKFRTMRQGADRGRSITSKTDSRVTLLGRLLRATKIDELPQLVNILVGDMSIVGPRPEDPAIVDASFEPEYMRMFDVRPGLASPGSIYNMTHGQALIGDETPEEDYRTKLLPVKARLEIYYVDNMSLGYDVRVILRTARVIVAYALGVRQFPPPPELAAVTAAD